MNNYMIAGIITMAFLLIALDRGRVLRDLILFVVLTFLHMWMAFVALFLSPLAMLAMVITGPILRMFNIIGHECKVTESMHLVFMHTLPGRSKDAAKAKEIIDLSKKDLSATLDVVLVQAQEVNRLKEAARTGTCPDCSGSLMEGPSGGACTMIKCSECGANFILTPGGLERQKDD